MVRPNVSLRAVETFLKFADDGIYHDLRVIQSNVGYTSLTLRKALNRLEKEGVVEVDCSQRPFGYRIKNSG